jgi:hypothetical protein
MGSPGGIEFSAADLFDDSCLFIKTVLKRPAQAPVRSVVALARNQTGHKKGYIFESFTLFV